jgi:hypothetical protein
MEKLLEQFEHVTDVVDKVEELIAEAQRTRGRKEKQRILREAQELADAYQRHCEAGGNDKQQFNQIYHG